MWRRPVGRAGSGPKGRGTYSIRPSDFDPLQLPGCKVVGGRVLPDDFIKRMKAARKNAPPEVNFVQQMRERKRDEQSQP